MSDASGQVVQHTEHFPSGESWISEQSSKVAPDPVYQFNSKELERATGLYAFGFRHYEPRLGQWLSPDPALDGYVKEGMAGGLWNPRNMGLYTYTWNDPVVLEDPDGRAPHVGVGAGV